MNISIEAHFSEDYLLLISKGRICNKEELFAHAEKKCHEAALYDHSKILLDNTGIDYPKEMYFYVELADFYSKCLPPSVRVKKIATLVSEKYSEIGYLWETACVNRGYPFRYFTCMEKASSWLRK